MGHNLIALAKKNPNNICVGFDPFLNCVANLVHTFVKENVSNIFLYRTPL